MGSFAKGEIVLFPFPYTDLSNRKLRPCLVISDEMRNDIILCQITSKRIPKDEYSIELTIKDTLDGNLMIDSYIRANMIFTASRDQIVKRICSVKNSKYDQVVSAINRIIG